MKISAGVEFTEYLNKRHNIDTLKKQIECAFRENNSDIYVSSEFFNIGCPYAKGILNTVSNTGINILNQLNNKKYIKTYKHTRHLCQLSLKHIFRLIPTEEEIIDYTKEIKKEIDRHGGTINSKHAILSLPYQKKEKIYNGCIVLSSNEKEPTIVYNKINPFDFENHLIDKGSEISTIKLKDIKIGVAICKDMYDGLLEELANKDIDVIVSPSNFAATELGMEYIEHRINLLEELKDTMYFAISTSAPQGTDINLDGGALIIEPKEKKVLRIKDALRGRKTIITSEEIDYKTLRKIRTEILSKKKAEIRQLIEPHEYKYRNITDIQKDTGLPLNSLENLKIRTVRKI